MNQGCQVRNLFLHSILRNRHMGLKNMTIFQRLV
uniref:Uncharacterized protein n=1 Tax=Anguilla anguilla TaxID=7936 RepID=A0A0E9UE21_ANGAN